MTAARTLAGKVLLAGGLVESLDAYMVQGGGKARGASVRVSVAIRVALRVAPKTASETHSAECRPH